MFASGIILHFIVVHFFLPFSLPHRCFHGIDWYGIPQVRARGYIDPSSFPIRQHHFFNDMLYKYEGWPEKTTKWSLTTFGTDDGASYGRSSDLSARKFRVNIQAEYLVILDFFVRIMFGEQGQRSTTSVTLLAFHTMDFRTCTYLINS